MFCPNCGEKLDDKAKFCSKCGKAVATIPQSTVAAPEAIPTLTMEEKRALLDRPIDQEIANMLMKAQEILHEAEYHNVNYQVGLENYIYKEASTGGFKNLALGILAVLEVLVLCVSVFELSQISTVSGSLSDKLGGVLLLAVFNAALIVPMVAIVRSRSNQQVQIGNEKLEMERVYRENAAFLEFLPKDFRTAGRVDYIINQCQAGQAPSGKHITCAKPQAFNKGERV